MSYENVKHYIEKIGLSDRITEHELTGDTVEHATEVIGCTPAEIAKALSFLVKEKPVMVVMAGDAKVNSSKFKAKFHQKPAMAPREDVERLVGHKPGGVCPFAINQDVPIYLDISMKRFEAVHTASGTDTATICVSITELEKYSGTVEWVDVCKGWYVNEAQQGRRKDGFI